MHACKPSVEGALGSVDGVMQFQVELPPKDNAWVLYDPRRTTIEAMMDAIEEAGYHVTATTLGYKGETKRS